jgi:hypothetical protein
VAIPAVFAVFAGNLQQTESRVPQKPWSLEAKAKQKTASDRLQLAKDAPTRFAAAARNGTAIGLAAEMWLRK